MNEIRILLLEDCPDDVLLIKRALVKAFINFSLKEISNKTELENEDLDGYNVIICDYKLQSTDGLSCIRFIRSKTDIPIISFSGSIPEEMGIDLLEAGSDDFLLKSSLKKLPYIVNKAVDNYRNKLKALECLHRYEEASQMFETLFDGLDNPVFLKDIDRKYLRVNAAFCKLYEKSERELIGKSDDEIVWEFHSDRFLQDDEHILRTGAPSAYETSYISPSGKKVWIEVCKSAIFSQGKITGILGQAKDITKRKDAISVMEKSQHILQQAEELTFSGSFEYDVDLDLVTCSKNMMKMLGIHSNQISLGRLVRLVKPKDRTMFLDGINESIENKNEYRMQHRYSINDKLQGNFEILFRPDFRDESGNTFYGTVLDVTKESVENVRRMQHQEDEQNEIARELHDNLGQKLNAISMYLGKAVTDGDNHPAITKGREILSESIDDLAKLISSISVKHIDDVSLQYAVEKLVSFLPEKTQVEVICEIDESTISQFVKRQAFRVVQEAVNNTLKYSQATKIKVNLSQQGSILNILVEDDGCGFAIDTVQLGNGLKNIKHRVGKANGLLNMDSQPGEGTRIKATLPVN